MNLLPPSKGAPVAVAHEVSDGDVLPFDGLRAIHTPGHTAGHLALLLPREGGVLFVGDAASNMLHAGLSPLNEDVGCGPARPSQARGPRVRGRLLRPRPGAARRGERDLPRARGAPRRERFGGPAPRRRLSAAGTRHRP